jgi:hypothetical protein
MTTMTYAGQQSTGFGGLGYGQEQPGLPQQAQLGGFPPWAFGGVSPLHTGQQFPQQQFPQQQYGPQQQQFPQISPWIALIVLATYLQQTLPQQGIGYGQVPQFSPYGQGQQSARPWQMGY